MKSKLILLLTLCFSAFLLNAQTDFRQAYIVNLQGDTLRGFIDYRNEILMGTVCRFKATESSEETRYAPADILSYRFNDGKYFVSKEVSGNKIFLEFLIKGKLDIYYFKNEAGDHYFLENDSLGLNEIHYKQEIVSIDNKQYISKSSLHKGALMLYMKDAPELKSKIEGIETPDRDNLVALAEDYHNKVCKSENCIIYEKKIPLIKLSFEPVMGFSKFLGSNVFNDVSYTSNYSFRGYLFDIGANLIFWMPRSNENFSFITGLVLSHADTINFYKLPMKIQYIFPSKKISPRFNLGFDVFIPPKKESMLTPLSLGFGILSKLNNHTSISLTMSTEFIDIPTRLISYSFHLGIYIH